MCLHDLDSVFHLLRAAGSGEALGTDGLQVGCIGKDDILCKEKL